MQKEIDIGGVLGFGWRRMKANIGFFIALGLLWTFFSYLPTIANTIIEHSQVSDETQLPLYLLTMFSGYAINIILAVGVIRIAISFVDGLKPPISTLFDFWGYFWKYLAGSILYMLIALAGFVLLIVPGIIWVVKYSLWPYFLIDRDMGPIEALKASGRATYGAKLQLFAFGIICGAIIWLGFVCLIVGVFAAYPTVMVANALVYRQLAGQTPELRPSGYDSPHPQAGQADIEGGCETA